MPIKPRTISTKSARRRLRDRDSFSREVARNLKLARESHGLTQTAVSLLFSPPIERAAVSQWESEESGTLPTIDKLDVLARSYGIAIDTLIHGPSSGKRDRKDAPLRSEVRDPSQRTLDLPRLLSPSKVAAVLDVSRSKVYKLMATGNLKFVRIGAERRIAVSELERLAAQGTRSNSEYSGRSRGTL
jgi:excisionase family DNA binding protein